jgi:hypothetical protein
MRQMSADDKDAELEFLYARLEALILAAVDMNDAAETAMYLLDDHPDARGHGGKMPWHVRRTLETGMFVTYARPFADTRGRPSMKRVSQLSKELRAAHDDIVQRRNRVYAHTDRTALRRILELSEPEERAAWVQDGGDPREEWFPPTPDGLRDVIALAHTQLASFLEEMGAIRRRIVATATS